MRKTRLEAASRRESTQPPSRVATSAAAPDTALGTTTGLAVSGKGYTNELPAKNSTKQSATSAPRTTLQVKEEQLLPAEAEEAGPPPGIWENPIPYRPRPPGPTSADQQRRLTRTATPVRFDPKQGNGPLPATPSFLPTTPEPSSDRPTSTAGVHSPPMSPPEAPLGTWGNPAPLVPSRAITALGGKRRYSTALSTDQEAVVSRKAAKGRRLASPEGPALSMKPIEPVEPALAPFRIRPTWVTAPPDLQPTAPTLPTPPLPPEASIDAHVDHIANGEQAVSSPLKAPSDDPLLLNSASGKSPVSEVEEVVEEDRCQVRNNTAPILHPAVSDLRPSPAPSASSSIMEIPGEDIKPIIARKKKFERPPHIRRLVWFNMSEAEQAAEAAREAQASAGTTDAPSLEPAEVPSASIIEAPPLGQPGMLLPAENSLIFPEEIQPGGTFQNATPTEVVVSYTPSRATSANGEKLSKAEWMTTVYEDGASDVEIVLDAASETSTYNGNMTDAERERYYRDHYNSSQVPPDNRRGVARRHFNCTATDEWNLKSPTYTKNNLLHMTIISIMFAAKEGVAGEIPISNTVDPDHAPPELEFEYSNEMLYGPRVPDPELGLGCRCDGPCNENDLGCSCLRRQQLYFYNMGTGFAYNQ